MQPDLERIRYGRKYVGYIRTDGGANEFHLRSKQPWYAHNGDCQVRAIAIATSSTYASVLKSFMFVEPKYPSIHKLMLCREFNGYRFKLVTLNKNNSPLEFAANHKRGRFVLFYRWGYANNFYACHYIASVDGTLYDRCRPYDEQQVPYAFQAIAC
jgi:hypothetical protein